MATVVLAASPAESQRGARVSTLAHSGKINLRSAGCRHVQPDHSELHSAVPNAMPHFKSVGFVLMIHGFNLYLRHRKTARNDSTETLK